MSTPDTGCVRAAHPALHHSQLQPGHRRRGRNEGASSPTTPYACGNLGGLQGAAEAGANPYRNTQRNICRTTGSVEASAIHRSPPHQDCSATHSQ
ncbi:hypothetical protein GCM10010350_84520 [Streptomyces galilaeus]|nr:hypothetical protein GCM10010350_84520 [Streptomyces galilaeus]